MACIGVGPRVAKVAFVTVKVGLGTHMVCVGAAGRRRRGAQSRQNPHRGTGPHCCRHRAQVYAIAMYVDQAEAVAFLKTQPMATDAGAAAALAGGAYLRAFQIHMVRSITGQQFSEAFDKALAPKMR